MTEFYLAIITAVLSFCIGIIFGWYFRIKREDGQRFKKSKRNLSNVSFMDWMNEPELDLPEDEVVRMYNDYLKQNGY